MPTKSLSRDRRLISSQPHEIAYAGKKLGKNGKARILAAKKTLGRTVSRAEVMAAAKSGKKK